jgi:hypothetical protein
MTAAIQDGHFYEEPVLNGHMSFVCWSALKTGKPHFPETTDVLDASDSIYGSSSNSFGRTWNKIQVHYHSNCTDYVQTATEVTALERSWAYSTISENIRVYQEGDCVMGSSVYCTLHDEQPAVCRLNVRMSAAFILAACLILKATYMLYVNLLARGKLKSHCLTFGDVIVASASDPELRVQGYEYMPILLMDC